MVRGKHAKPTRRLRPPIDRPQRRFGRKRVVLAVAVCFAVMAGCTGAFAWLHTESGLRNAFQLATVTPGISETFEQGSTVKENVTLKNDGNVDAYLRASISVRWEVTDGNGGTLVLGEVPVLGADYTITWGTDPGWVLGTDGLYYWTAPVAAGSGTANLINTCVWNTPSAYADNRRLVVEIDAQSVQASPTDAVLEAWGVGTGGAVTAVDGGTEALTIKTAGTGVVHNG